MRTEDDYRMVWAAAFAREWEKLGGYEAPDWRQSTVADRARERADVVVKALRDSDAEDAARREKDRIIGSPA